ncbi:unnamed protein product [Medioppia subpectinata]|uniref:Uncharacterized protein n=1 Tax=Medioppia subpectinata TaxID=1979941 RepID=A0A7R9PUP5_9ACAR|nr:unnamed protein product [Medioppia subpectinata]CAG2101982.1 unnamed protein product [Medioppia subpectinata]
MNNQSLEMRGTALLSLLEIIYNLRNELIFLAARFGRNVGLYFKPLQYEPRIYQKAGPGVHVVTLDAYFEPNIGGYTGIVYVLEAIYDHQYFAIDKYSGDLTTNWQIDREIGQSYNSTYQ